MGKVIRTKRWDKARGHKSKGHSPKSYTPSDPTFRRLSGLRDTERKRGIGWFVPAMIALPLAAFSAVMFFPATDSTPSEAFAAAGMTDAVDRERANFPLCSGGRRTTCVVDGDTIWYRGEKIRLVGFDTPETRKPGCAREARLGGQATRRLQDWLNAGAFSLEANPDGRSRDRYGRRLLVVSRGGKNVSEVMLAEGLAERRGGRRNVWC